jgi:hypothetical protein
MGRSVRAVVVSQQRMLGCERFAGKLCVDPASNAVTM